jgi:hypothetical protein
MPEQSQKAGRLSTVVRPPQLKPWRKAPDVPFHFYWMPVSAFPTTFERKRWMVGFFEQFGETLRTRFNLAAEVFLHHKSVVADQASFVGNARKFRPMIGLARRPGSSSLPVFPAMEELQRLAKSGEIIDMTKYVGDLCHWFTMKLEREQRAIYQGCGGLSLIYRKPDPKVKPPEIPIPPQFRARMDFLKTIDLDAMLKGAFALTDEFLAKSKALFGKGLEQEPLYEALLYIVPLWTANDLFALTAPEIEAAFGLFDVYVRESPEDDGVLMASRTDFEKPMVQAIIALRQQGLLYPEVD